jgi:hypothetical protein
MQLLKEKELDVLWDADYANSGMSLGARELWTIESLEEQMMMRKVSEQAEKDLIDLENYKQREMAKDYRDYEIN